MSTRGTYGFRIDGQDKVTYNHCDSYPSGLGEKIVDFIKSFDDAELIEIAKRIELIDKNSVPNADQISQCVERGFANFDVAGQSDKDWYCLLRHAHGDLTVYQNEPEKVPFVFMIDGQRFLRDSLFCEWAYIINLDDLTLEVYAGFNQNPNESGRYATYKDEEDSEYYGVRLLKAYPLDEIRSLPIDDFIDEIEELTH